MRSKTFTFIVVVIGLISIWHTGVLSQEALSNSEGIERLKIQIEGVIQGVEEKVGVAVKHVESGEELYTNGDTLFPMASAFKIPICVEVMAQVSRFVYDYFTFTS
jgi:beta-lactamase class A